MPLDLRVSIQKLKYKGFNGGSIVKDNVLHRMGFSPGKYMVQGLKLIDARRKISGDREVQEQSKKKRIQRRLGKKSREEIEEEAEDYIPGGF